MSDKDYLNWPFLDDAHRQLEAEVDRWGREVLPTLPVDHHDVDASCRTLVRELGAAGFLARSDLDALVDRGTKCGYCHEQHQQSDRKSGLGDVFGHSVSPLHWFPVV